MTDRTHDTDAPAIDRAEADRLALENLRLLEENASLNRALDEAREERDAVLPPSARADAPRSRISGAGEAALVVRALVALHSASHGTSRYDGRFLAAATRLGEQLAADTSPPG